MKTQHRRASCLLLFLLVLMIPLEAQDKADTEIVNRLWEAGTNRSQVMSILSYLTDVIGPRIPGSPAMGKAYEWATAKLKEWGLENVQVEPCGEFGLGWANEHISIHLLEPSYQPLIGYPVPWTLGTNGKIKGQPILAVINSKEDFEKYRGKLKGAIVLAKPPRKAPPVFTPDAVRDSPADLDKLTETPIPVKPEKAGSDPAPLKWEELEDFFQAEGVGVLLQPSDPSRRDYGTVKVDAYDGDGKNHIRRNQNPRIILAAEHYNRICRILDHKVPAVLEVEVVNRIYDQDLQGYNVVAEIPGTDKKDEIVMLGGHLDSWAGGTGAVDDASGCAVAMEVVRLFKELGVKPRRTIRVALWTGEEEGFYGSRGYVVRHFGDTDKKTLSQVDWEAQDKSWRKPLIDSTKILAKPEYDKISGYFNYDNGSGRILGIYIQENFGVRPIFEEWMKPLQDLGVKTIAFQPTDGTDHLPFDWIGIPGFQFIQDTLDYGTRCHHTNQDLYDHCVPEDIIQSVVVMGSFVYHTAMRKDMLPRKPLPIPVEREKR